MLTTAYILNNKANLYFRDSLLELIAFLINSALLMVKKLLYNLGSYNSKRRIVTNELINLRNSR